MRVGGVGVGVCVGFGGGRVGGWRGLARGGRGEGHGGRVVVGGGDGVGGAIAHDGITAGRPQAE